ncbi:MAG: hypothetical protein LBC85_05705 [Fibromonadaceae bacterium]|jgi:hypothetical protein|nr:hypothetical protein [Fibromonadaceae bacterium]
MDREIISFDYAMKDILRQKAKWVIFTLLFAINAFSQALSIDGGANYFLGSLQKEIKNHPYGGFGFELGLSDWTTGYISGTFSYVKLKNNTDFDGLYQFLGRAGIETSERIFKFAALGMGVSLAGVRGDDATPEAEKYMLNTSESQFGWNLRLKLNLLRINSFTFGTKFNYDHLWTSPKNSSLLQGGIFIGYNFLNCRPCQASNHALLGSHGELPLLNPTGRIAPNLLY